MPENYVLLERTELNASAASVTFANIPQTGYTDLKVVMSARGVNANTFNYMSIAFNGSTANQTRRQLEGDGSGASSASSTNFQFISDGGNNTANTFGNHELYIPNYTSSNFKSASLDSVMEENGTTAYADFMALLWSNTAAITSIVITGITGSFAANSTFSLYGIAAVGTTPAIAPKASGGNVIAYDGTYWYHAFLSTGTFMPAVELSCDYLVVAGGGGAGGYGGPGGGAGGFRTASSQSLTAQPYTVTVGAGGASGTGQTAGISGSNSTLSATTSAGGGGTGYGGTGIQSGGSGGGGFGGLNGPMGSSLGGYGNTPSTSPSQGNNGGSGAGASNYGTGGGGGAGAVGGDGTGGAGGNGGVGSFTAISGGATTALGVLSGGNYYFAAGGAGATTFGGTAGTGGIGSGGNAGAGGGNNNGFAGTTNTGGGGGGGSYQNAATSAGGAGGSGIVIVRYTAE